LVIGIGLSVVPQDTSAQSAVYYTFDAHSLLMNQSDENFDKVAFLLSVQGNVNRESPRLFIKQPQMISVKGSDYSPDTLWKNAIQSSFIWLNPRQYQETVLTDINQVITTFAASSYGIDGSVVWDKDRPWTLNIAASIAGARNLAIVRKQSPIYATLTAHYPVVVDLTTDPIQGFMTTKSSAYQWLLQEYLLNSANPHRLEPTLASLKDGYALKNRAMNTLYFGRWISLEMDAAIARKALIFDLSPNADLGSPEEQCQAPSSDYTTLTTLLQNVRNRKGTQPIEVMGFLDFRYIYCEGNGQPHPTDEQRRLQNVVTALEHPFAKVISQYGGMMTVGGIGPADAANGSFFRHSPGVRYIPQSPAMTPETLLRNDYADGYPLNFSFEKGGVSQWTMWTTNYATYAGTNLPHGSTFLEMNTSTTDWQNGKNTLYQDVPIALLRGSRYQLRLSARRNPSEVGSIQGGIALWGKRANGSYTQLNHCPFTLTSGSWVPIACDTDIREDGLHGIRLQIALYTPDKNYDFDAITFLGPNTLRVNPTKTFGLFYMGDYDGPGAAYSTLMADVNDEKSYNELIWTSKITTTVPVAWAIAPSFRDAYPSAYAYLAKTKGPYDYFMMPNSGPNYTNPLHFDSLASGRPRVGPFKQQTATLNREVGYRVGWVLDGAESHLSYSDPTVRSIFKIATPDGYIHNSNVPPIGPTDPSVATYDGHAAILRKTTDLVDHATTDTDGADRLIAHVLAPQAAQFQVYRSIFVSSNFISHVVSTAKTKNLQFANRFAALDPMSFFGLYKSQHGLYPRLRMSMVSDTLPQVMYTGQSYAVQVTIRNDGWDIWRPKPSGATDCDGSGLAYKGCDRFVWTFQPPTNPIIPTGPGAIPTVTYPSGNRIDFGTTIAPGATTTVNLMLTIPANATLGYHTFQADLVQEGYGFGETYGNQPWQGRVLVATP